MAVKSFDKALAKKKHKLTKRSVFLVTLILLIVSVVFTTSAVNYIKAADYSSQAQSISEECSKLADTNNELKGFLQNENHDEYFEKIAREKYGYAKPGERVYYDSSFGD